ncbi:MAG: C39 family peptidase [Candidatus Aminicenantales bacterium]
MQKGKYLILAPLLSIVVSVFYASEIPKQYLIEGVRYYPMLDGYCAMTALRMNLKYYGLDVEPSFLLNMGWNYGFVYIKSPFYTVAYPDTDPVEEIVFASKLLGFKTEILIHQSREEAKKSLVKYISTDKPVIVQWIPHTVLAYGYRESGDRIIYHDPAQPVNNIMASYLKDTPIGKGEGALMEIAEWEKFPFLWGMRQFQMVVLEPKNPEIKINWKDIWKRNAQKTLGIIKNPYPAYYGLEGIKELIKDLKNISIKDNKKLSEFLRGFKMTFEIGVGFRRNAASFLSGQASLSNDKNLIQASIAFRESAHLFREGLVLINNWINNRVKKYPEGADDVRKALIDTLEKIVNSEQRGAEFLLEASKKDG